MAAAEDLAGRIGQTAEACEALGVARSTLYRRRRPVTSNPKRRPRPHRALDETEREQVLGALHSERFVDKAPAAMWATLLDEGTYYCSIRTMYRILAEQGEVRERRNQLRHPNYRKPELLAEAPNQVWSWDITKLRGPVKWTYYYLFVILDILLPLRHGLDAGSPRKCRARSSSHRRELSQARHRTRPAHHPRGSWQLDAKQVRRLASGRPRRYQDSLATSRLERQSLLRVSVQDAEVLPPVPASFRLHRGCSPVLPQLLRLLQPRTPPLGNRSHDTGRRSSGSRRTTQRGSPTHASRRSSGSSRTLRPWKTSTPCFAVSGLDQPPT